MSAAPISQESGSIVRNNRAYIHSNAQNDIDVMVFPNPVEDVLTVQIIGTFDNLDSSAAYIINSSGSIVESFNIYDKYIFVDVSNLSKGLYSLSFMIEGKSIVKEFIKQ